MMRRLLESTPDRHRSSTELGTSSRLSPIATSGLRVAQGLPVVIVEEWAVHQFAIRDLAQLETTPG
jgi:hypothetical protein